MAHFLWRSSSRIGHFKLVVFCARSVRHTPDDVTSAGWFVTVK